MYSKQPKQTVKVHFYVILLTWIGGISGREGRFSGFVTEGISSIAATDGLVGPRFALAMVAVVGLVGLIVLLCTETTGKGPACPGFECCWDKRRELIMSVIKKNKVLILGVKCRLSKGMLITLIQFSIFCSFWLLIIITILKYFICYISEEVKGLQ